MGRKTSTRSFANRQQAASLKASRGDPEGAALPPLPSVRIVHYGEKGRLTPRYLSRGPCQAGATP